MVLSRLKPARSKSLQALPKRIKAMWKKCPDGGRTETTAIVLAAAGAACAPGFTLSAKTGTATNFNSFILTPRGCGRAVDCDLCHPSQLQSPRGRLLLCRAFPPCALPLMHVTFVSV